MVADSRQPVVGISLRSSEGSSLLVHGHRKCPAE
jgi:hypothetical protein